MVGFLTPLINILVAMGASTFSAYICVILGATLVGFGIGASLDNNSLTLAKVCALVCLFFSVALVLAEVFPWH